ncbi:Dyp-type peroxidase [Sphaerisporangium viridialbum]|uniref:Dyp-type peroxidase n=1 Tax=Sphaerisporangium viridialbum TaxID=46189 RepID=UPI003C7745CC
MDDSHGRIGRGAIGGAQGEGAGVRRRSFLKGAMALGAAGVAAGRMPEATARAATGHGPSTFPFHGLHQAGIDRPPPTQAQPVAGFASFEVTAANRNQLTDLFRALTDRARFLASGGAPPNTAPRDNDLLGAMVVPDGLTITAAVGASLFDDRYGLAPRKPVQLERMRAFEHDDLDEEQCHGDLLLQLCANHQDVLAHALVDIMAHTDGALRPRWRADGFRNPPRPSGTPRDMLGFKDGIANPDTGDARQMNQLVWAQPRTREPAWTAGGTYQAVRVVRFFIEKWNTVPIGRQESIIGRRKATGAPMYGTDESQDPVYTNDPQGRLTPLHAHIRLANPQTPETAATSAILRRSYQFDRAPRPGGATDMGHVFCCYQRELHTYIAMQTRLESEPLVEYISPFGGGYFFVLPGVRDTHDHYASGLLAT